MNMIERVARSINPEAYEKDLSKTRYLFKCWQDQAKVKALNDARAAIEAMKTPTDAMVNSMYGFVHQYDGKKAWSIMITAALNEDGERE